MNKQELVKKYKRLEGVWDAEGAEIARRIFLLDLYQLDEPEKVKVPQFVADVIEGAREQSAELEDAFEYARDAAFRGEMSGWFMKLENRNTFARAWLDGYDVEEEKRYLVKIKGICGNHETLNRKKHSNKWLFSDREENSLYNTKFTRKELKEAGFGWVFDCEGIEVEEATE